MVDGGGTPHAALKGFPCLIQRCLSGGHVLPAYMQWGWTRSSNQHSLSPALSFASPPLHHVQNILARPDPWGLFGDPYKLTTARGWSTPRSGPAWARLGICGGAQTFSLACLWQSSEEISSFFSFFSGWRRGGLPVRSKFPKLWCTTGTLGNCAAGCGPAPRMIATCVAPRISRIGNPGCLWLLAQRDEREGQYSVGSARIPSFACCTCRRDQARPLKLSVDIKNQASAVLVRQEKKIAIEAGALQKP